MLGVSKGMFQKTALDFMCYISLLITFSVYVVKIP